MKISINKLNILCVCLILLMSCQDAEIAPKEYPYVLMEEVSTSQSGAKFTANVIMLGSETILSHGFVWGDKVAPNIYSDDFKNISSDLAIGHMALEINSGLMKNQTYYVRPFIKTKRFLVYGSELSFSSEGSNPPQIHDFEPKFGPVGTSIEITGINFGFSAKSNTVKLGQYIAEIDSATDTKLYVKVPQVTEPGKVDLTVETAGMLVKSNNTFDLYFPWLKLSTPHNLNYASSFTIAGKVYLINSNTSSGLRFDSSNETWQPINLPGNAGQYPMAFSISNKGYALLRNGFYEYDPVSNSWTQKANFPDNISDRRYAYTMSFNQIGFIGFCYNNQKLWAYDPSTNAWIRKSDFPKDFTQTTFPVHGNFSFSIGDKGYVGISQSASDIDTFWEYELISDSWKEKSPLPSNAFNFYACMVINGNAYVGLGTNFVWGDGYVSNAIWKYDQLHDRWERFQNCPTSMAVYASFGIGNKGYMLSGFTRYSRSLKEIWEFDPRKN